MTDITNPFSDLDLEQAIGLRWTLRDIAARRWILCPINPTHIETLIAMDLVEMRDGVPVLKQAGRDVLG
jgi:hypothetical protein